MLVVCVLGIAASFTTQGASAAQARPERVVIVTLPGVTWADVLRSHTPALDELMRTGAAASMSVRVATRGSTPERGYISLGAARRGYLSLSDPVAQLGFESDGRYGEGTALEALRQRVGVTRAAGVVHLGMPVLQAGQDARLFGTRVGALGEALAEAGIPRAVVSAADLDTQPSPSDRRRSAVLGIVDRQGTVDHGVLDGLVVADPEAAYGVRTDPDAFVNAVGHVLETARVVLVDPGETLRADEFAPQAEAAVADRHMQVAVRRSDGIIGAVREMLGPRDVLIVAAVSGPRTPRSERLVPLIASGPGFESGRLVSGTSRYAGLVGLWDVAPTVLSLLGLPLPGWMSDTPFRSVGDPEPDIARAMEEINLQAMFRDSFADPVFAVYVGLTIILAALAVVALLARRHRLLPLVHWIALAILAVPPATVLLRLAGTWRGGVVFSHLVLWTTVLALAALARLVRGPRWAGALALLVLSAAVYGADLATGAQLQPMAVFGHSPIIAGRFYGVSNAGLSILYASGILGLLGMIDLLGYRRAPVWVAGALTLFVVLVGLPPFGANFGGLITGVVSVALAFALARWGRLRWRTIVVVGAAAVAVTVAVSLLDMARPVQEQTHFGRFAASVIAGGFPALWQTAYRKASASFATLDYSGWTLLIPVAASVVAVLLHRPRGVLRDVVVERPVLRAGLWAVLVAGVVGFAVNDSGIVIPGVIVAHAVPLMVLMGSDAVAGGSAARAGRLAQRESR